MALHALGLLAVQALGLRPGPPPPEAAEPIQLVDLIAPPTPAPAPEPDVEQTEPAPQPEETIEPEPEQRAEPEPIPEPEQRAEPEPQPEPEPQQQAEAAPSPPAPAIMLPEEDEASEDGAAGSMVVPGIRYRATRDSAAANFLHAVECASINIRYEDYCADIGPIYLVENAPERLAPEHERIWAAQKAAERARETKMEPIKVCEGGTSCIPDPETFEARGMRIRDWIQ